jgi:hypothetical protein
VPEAIVYPTPRSQKRTRISEGDRTVTNSTFVRFGKNGWNSSDGQQAVLYRSRMNPSLGRNFEAFDPLEWLARMSDHIPDPGQHRTLFDGEYSNRVRGCGHPDDREPHAGEAPEPRRRCSPSWARLIAKVYQADPLVCTRCGKRMRFVAFVTDQVAIGRILEHLGLSAPEAEKPPPPVREILRVAEGGDGGGVPAPIGSEPRAHKDLRSRGRRSPSSGRSAVR